MRPHRGLAFIAVLLASLVMTLVLPATAQAERDDTLRAKELYRNGERLYEEGLYEDAIVAWELAFELSKRPLLLYNIANALERIGKWEEALRRINQYRALAPEEERETLDRRMRAIERRLEQKREADEKATRDAAAVRVTQAKPGAANNNTNLLELSPRQQGAQGPQGSPTGAIILMGIGGAGLSAGGIMAGLALEARSQAELACKTSGNTSLCPTAAGPVLDRDASLSVGADISLVAGGTALGAGIILCILDMQGVLPKRERRVVVLPGAGASQASLTVAGVF